VDDLILRIAVVGGPRRADTLDENKERGKDGNNDFGHDPSPFSTFSDIIAQNCRSRPVSNVTSGAGTAGHVKGLVPPCPICDAFRTTEGEIKWRIPSTTQRSHITVRRDPARSRSWPPSPWPTSATWPWP